MVVSAAAGAVGSVIGQAAKIQGCRAVGSVGSDAKCRYVVEGLGLDACLNDKSQNLDRALAGACPASLDVYFNNVGGDCAGGRPAAHQPRRPHLAGRPHRLVQKRDGRDDILDP